MSKQTLVKLLSLIAVFSVINGCDNFYWDAADKKDLVGSQKVLRVAALKDTRSYQKIGDRTWGLEQDLLQNFADEFGLKLRTHFFNSYAEVEQAVARGSVDLAAGQFKGSARSSLFAGPAYMDTALVEVCRADLTTRPTTIWLSTVNSSLSLQRRLNQIYGTAHLEMGEQTSKILRAVLESESSCAVLEKTEAVYYLRFFPSLQISRKLKISQKLHFIASQSNLRLQKMLFVWHQQIAQNGTLIRIKERYLRPLVALSRTQVNYFFSSYKTAFREYETLFKEAAREHKVPWQILAAVSFQESHWNADSVSFTGVRGLMMLTSETAETLDINDRTDPEQCIWGGAKYLKYLLSLQPPSLPLRERWALALASYNVGQGHLRDAQKLAVSLGKNPYAWKDLRTVLPLLSDPTYNESLEFGAARGQEPVDFTERVLGYLDLMTTKI